MVVKFVHLLVNKTEGLTLPHHKVMDPTTLSDQFPSKPKPKKATKRKYPKEEFKKDPKKATKKETRKKTQIETKKEPTNKKNSKKNSKKDPKKESLMMHGGNNKLHCKHDD